MRKYRGYGLLAIGLLMAAVSVWGFVSLGLDKSDKLASILSFFVAMLALGITVYGVTLTRRSGERPGVSVTGSSVGGVILIDDVAGAVKIRRHTPRGGTPPAPPTKSTRPTDRQTQADLSVTDSSVADSVDSIRHVGELEIDE